MRELGIVTGSFNRLPYLQKMVNSARRSLPFGIAYIITVVDGGSTDGTLEWCRQQRDIQLIEHGELRGAIAAFNDGAYATQANWIILANDDIEFVDRSITRALVFMHDNPHCGVGAFFQDRSGQSMHVSPMPAHYPDGRMTSVIYGQVCIVQKELGDALHWWEVPGSRTYGGDCALSARAIEAGWQVLPIPGAEIHDNTLPQDELRRINNPPRDDTHPDTQAYLRLFPRGPQLGAPQRQRTNQRPMRILYAPIYESGHVVQHEQKRGLRRALQRIGLVQEIDYLAQGAEAILSAANVWQPDLFILQLHDATLFTPSHAARLRREHPHAKIVSWSGDVYDRVTDSRFGPQFAEALRQIDLYTTVNETAVHTAERAGIRAAYWQIGYEPDGVGYEPDANTRHHDVLLLGNGYSPDRHRLASLLKSLPYAIGIYGAFYPDGVAYPPNTYDFRTGCKLYRAAKIAISDDQWGQRGFVSNRLLQCLVAGGALALQQWVDGLDTILGFKDGEHLIYYQDNEDLEMKLDYWLAPARDAERRQIALRGQAFTLKAHSFEARVQQLFALLEPPKAEPGVDPALAAFHDKVVA
jgi:hypothetical protein